MAGIHVKHKNNAPELKGTIHAATPATKMIDMSVLKFIILHSNC